MKPQLITVDIPGLDLALGGGIWAVHRFPDANASATLLLRGPPGSGKTAFGTQLAAALGVALKGDVAYGCVELLPVELQAQYANLQPESPRAKVLVPPFQEGAPKDGTQCRIFAGLLDLGASGQEQARLGPAIHALLDEVSRSKGRPRVLVIDSLSEGYGLGGSAPRPLADALSKLAAERGLILVLLEEAIDTRPSTWSFTSDVVLELANVEEDRAPGLSAPFERRVTVTKNRFGPSDAGPHRFEFFRWGLHLYPRPTAYLAPWADDVLQLKALGKRGTAQRGWAIPGLPPGWLNFHDSVTAVHGPEAHIVREVSQMLGRETSKEASSPGGTFFIDFMRQSVSQRVDVTADVTWIFGAGNPYMSGHRLLASVRGVLSDIRDTNLILGKVIIGDLRSLRSFWNPEGLRRAIAVITAMLRKARIPVVLFETTAPRQFEQLERVNEGGAFDRLFSRSQLIDLGQAEPHVVDFADVVVELLPTTFLRSAERMAGITDVRTGRHYAWNPFPDREGEKRSD
jgi:KaiC/GvpD/RAD55 family RecA-like ATPase